MTRNLYFQTQRLREQRRLLQEKIYDLEMKLEDSKFLRKQRYLLQRKIYDMERNIEDNKILNYSLFIYTSIAIGIWYFY